MITLADSIKLLEAYYLTLVVLGLGVLGLAALLHRFDKYPLSFPIVVLTLGYAAFALPLGLTPPDPFEHGAVAVHLTELGVIISLMGVGLKIDRAPSWKTWSPTLRLILICMPLTIAGVALLGWWMLGLAPAAALLLGAVLAATDPVLASDVQVGEPEPDGSAQEDESGRGEQGDTAAEPTGEEDELRFSLTSEAGLNDSLVFPFTYLSLLMLSEGVAPANWFGEWLLVDVAYRLIVGVGAGFLLGLGLSRILLNLPVDTERQKIRTGVGALAATLLFYGITEALGGYGFLAVFIGSLTIKQKERDQQSHKSLHTFAEQSEQLLMTGILLALGGAIAGGLLAPLTWEAALIGLLLVFLIRPAAGMIGLFGERRLSGIDRLVTSFFGIRGIGCLFYLAYALQEGDFPDEDLLWAICGFTVALSVIVHGITSSPVMKVRDRRVERKEGESAA